MPGERACVRQVCFGEQPPVLAAGAGLHPSAGGHPGVPADLPLRPRPQPRQGRSLLQTARAEQGRGVKLQHAAQKNGDQFSLNSKR